MDGTIFTLLVGINRYLPPVSALYGCCDDVASIEAALRQRFGDRLAPLTLLDEAATRQSVIDSFTAHLGQAGPDDVAVFVYAGHGSEEPAPPEFAKLESTNRIQTFMLYDCGRRDANGKLCRALADKELAVLIDGVAERAGHVVVILDCCSSGGATRDPDTARSRGWQPRTTGDVDLDHDTIALTTARSTGEFLPGTIESWDRHPVNHVALSACESWETAKEVSTGPTPRGAFSVALIESLDALGDDTTYRALLATVASRVDRAAADQNPVLYPTDLGGLGDARFIDGTIEPTRSTFTLTQRAGGLSVNAGLIHGLRPPVGDEAFILACSSPADPDAGMVRVLDVATGDSTVEALDWIPLDVAYSAVIAEVPLPSAEVVFDEPIATVIDAVATCGTDASPSLHVRVTDDASVPAGPRFRLRSPAPGVATIMRPNGSSMPDELDVSSQDGALGVAHRLEHLARWEMIRALGSHPSPLRNSVAFDVFDAAEGETARPDNRPARDASSSYRLEYLPNDDGTWSAPWVFFELRNTTPDELFVAVLDLTDRFQCATVLQTCKLASGGPLSVSQSGAPFPITLPATRMIEPGASARDWLKLIVSDVVFDASAFALPALGEESPPASSTRSAPATWGTIERLAAKAVSRLVGEPPAKVANWAATTIELHTVIP